jgi:ribosomal protein S18 acetylase RimI-like enzyme
MVVVCRAAQTEEEARECYEIAKKSSRQLGPVTPRQLIDHIKKGELLVAYIQTNIVGFIRWHRRLDNMSVIYEICVLGARRLQGIGRAMVNNLPLPIQLKVTEDNYEAHTFYSKIGFVRTNILEGKKRKLFVYTKLMPRGNTLNDFTTAQRPAD